MSASDDLRRAKEFFAADSFSQETGLELVSVSPGRATVSMQICDRHKNSHGTVHGGALFTLADTAFALASNSHGIPAAGINASISYLTAARDGILTAEAEEFTGNPKLASYTVVITDDKERKIAIFQGMVYRKTPKRDI
ncbi:PaaI family thioesterase [Methanogenium organophilum]|uniref:PaaI family thioesterase n=1 Tax=Methanogenium organophilum TaxID=2199 RepID=A0A9X9S528_METOG|nr:PaaI family thioesterase [Methanogenium organophilum]WAI02204.1 PaaI family thioesterase [Methanogenium organophilum]